jgi:hypothetical protein
MDFNQFAFWMLTGLLGALLIVIWKAMSRLADSVEALNKTMAVEIEKSKWIMLAIDKHDRILEKHEERLTTLEKA